MSRASKASKVHKPTLNTQNLFYADRVSTYKKFVFDTQKDANCTSEKLALAGFVCTATKGSPTSAKCPFCSKELEFDPEDDPWEEHKKRGETCEFVKLNKLDEKLWTVRDVLFLGAVLANNAKYDELRLMLDQMAANATAESLKKLTIGDTKAAPRTRKARK